MTLDQNRDQIAAIADALIPPADGWLSGSQAGIPGRALDDACLARPDLVPALEAAATAVAAAGSAIDELAALRARDPAGFDDLFLLVRGAYFLNRRVCEQLGYDGATAWPLSDAVEPDYLDLVAEVIDRGPVYREAGPTRTVQSDYAEEGTRP